MYAWRSTRSCVWTQQGWGLLLLGLFRPEGLGFLTTSGWALGHVIETYLPAWQRMARSSTLGVRAKDKGGRFVQEIDPHGSRTCAF